MTEDIKIADALFKIIGEEMSPESTIFNTIANIKKVTHPTTTPMPKPEPPDPHLYETQALQAQILRILQALGLTHT